MASIYDWSTTPASNSNSDADMTWAEGQAPSTVNNSARQLVARVAEFRDDIGGSLSAGGTANGLTVTAKSAFTVYANGQIISFRATADNTGAATLNVNGIGAKAIRKMDSTGDVALISGELQATGIYVAQYSTALNGAAGAWLLINPTLPPSLVGGAAASTDNALVRWDGATGRVIQNSGILIDDSNNVSGMGTLSAGAITSSGTVTAGQNFVSASATFLVLATSGTGQILIRPQGAGSTAGQVSISNSGLVTTSAGLIVGGSAVINGTLTVTG